MTNEAPIADVMETGSYEYDRISRDRRPTLQQRVARGRAARKQSPRQELGTWAPGALAVTRSTWR